MLPDALWDKNWFLDNKMVIHRGVRRFNLYTIIFLTVWTVSNSDNLPTCQPTDFHFEYTTCDSNGQRWRVSVPNPGTCTGGAPNAPVQGKDCSFECSAGQYLDLKGDQDCHPCPAGTYSLGGGVLYEDWDHVPAEFSVTTETFSDDSYMYSEYFRDESNCTDSGWIPQGSSIASYPGACTANLVYSANLVTAGHVKFEYQYTDRNTLFHFIMQNDQCQAYDDKSANKWPKHSDEGKWNEMTVPLKTGLNVIYWRTIGISDEVSASVKPVRLRKIEITGVAFNSQCTKCRSGTFSTGGTSICTQCGENMHSNKGAGRCTPCDKNSEYAWKGADKCLKRPACTVSDYYEYQTACDSLTHMTHKTFKWVEPHICRADITGAVQLPAAGTLVDCPPCNPGMQFTNGSGCHFCPTGSFSDGSVPCRVCPVSTSPDNGLEFKWWYSMPPNVSSSCLVMTTDGDCVSNSTWLPSGDRIETHFGRGEDAYLMLDMDISGFRGEEGVVDGRSIEVGTMALVFETSCRLDCHLYLIGASDLMGTHIIKEWKGTQKKAIFSHAFSSNASTSFTLAFRHGSWGHLNDSQRVEDKAIVYSIKITNTLNGGAIDCTPCPRGTLSNNCIPCPDGFYIDTNTTQCMECPANTVIHSSNSWGSAACKTCGHGLKASGGKYCISDCKYTSQDGKEYDFSQLKGFHYLGGTRLFTSSGTQYYHGYNISLCGHAASEMASCINNVTYGDEDELNAINEVDSLICRSTYIPPWDKTGKLLSTQPVSLGDHLVQITTNNSIFDGLPDEGFDKKDKAMGIHFVYKADMPTAACPSGRTTIITVRCDIKQDGLGIMQLPPKCPDGTCNGCSFHFLWRSQKACPVCRSEDYDIIRGECVNGEQTIHYYPPKQCMLLDDHKPKTSIIKCKLVPLVMEISIIAALGVGLLLLTVVVYCWKKNRKLEYKYMKLVGGTGNNPEGELPSVDSCGLEDDEEEHFDKVNVRLKGSNFLKNLRSKFSNKNEETMFGSIQMTEKFPMT